MRLVVSQLRPGQDPEHLEEDCRLFRLACVERNGAACRLPPDVTLVCPGEGGGAAARIPAHLWYLRVLESDEYRRLAGVGAGAAGPLAALHAALGLPPDPTSPAVAAEPAAGAEAAPVAPAPEA
eukprot:tig00021098_g18193.t1